jgi:lactoylglutathione lyase
LSSWEGKSGEKKRGQVLLFLKAAPRLGQPRVDTLFMHLYETHLPVADTERSARFYVEVLGLTFGYRDPGRDIVFLYIGADRRSMLGLWGPGTTHGRDREVCRHFAIAVTLEELLAAGEHLNALGIATRNFAGDETAEPSVIGWMPSAQLYFRDPDGHSVELLALLDDPPAPAFIGPLSNWLTRDRT